MADTDYLAASDGTGNAALMHITSPRTALATVIQVDTVSGVPAFFIGTWGTLGADGFITAASARDFFGHVNAGTLVIDKMAPGNVDGGNTSGQVVVIKPATPTQNLVANFVKTALNNFGEGQLLNGKIVPSIATNNLVLAIKTLNGVDPSTTDVVYVRIGNTVRTITAPLSVTLAAGTNWFSKGSAPFVGLATNFYAYLGWNATDGVTLGVSSTAGALRYGDFSTTNTDWTYAKISTVTNATATDVYENIGYFNAILGATATFLWTLPSPNVVVSAPSSNRGAGLVQLGFQSGSPAGTVIPNAYTTYATVTAVSTGGRVLVIGNASIKDGSSGSTRTGHIRVQCDGVTIPDTDIVWQTISSGVWLPLAMTMGEHIPTAGSHVWTFQVEADTASASTIFGFQFLVQEMK